MRMHWRIGLAVCAFLSQSAYGIPRPELGGHVFSKTSIIANPFINSYVGANLETGFSSLREASLEAEVKSIGLSPSFSGLIRVWRFGLELTGTTAIIAGTDAYSALILGAVISYGGRAALKFVALDLPKVRASIELSSGYQPGIAFSPLTAAAQALTSLAQVTGSSFVINTTRWDIHPKMTLAITPIPFLGLLGEAGYSWGTVYSGTTRTDSSFLRLGLSMSQNWLRVASWLPLSSIIGFRADIAPRATQSALSPILSLALVENFRSEFGFGVEFTRLFNTNANTALAVTMNYYY